MKGDRLGEVSENFFLKLQGAKNAKINNRFGTAIVTIRDDEPRISISNGVQASATTLWSFDVSLSRLRRSGDRRLRHRRRHGPGGGAVRGHFRDAELCSKRNNQNDHGRVLGEPTSTSTSILAAQRERMV